MTLIAFLFFYNRMLILQCGNLFIYIFQFKLLSLWSGVWQSLQLPDAPSLLQEMFAGSIHSKIQIAANIRKRAVERIYLPTLKSPQPIALLYLLLQMEFSWKAWMVLIWLN